MAGQFTPEEIRADLAGLPASAFNKTEMDVRVQWMETVLDVEPQARGKHDLRFYTGVGRLLADVVCSTQPEDYADDYVRDVIKANFKAGDTPFNEEGNPESWKTLKMTPAMVVFALRVQTAFAKSAGMEVAQGSKEFVKCQAEKEKQTTKPKGSGRKDSCRKRSPAIDLMPSGGSWDDRLKAALDMKKARSLEERVHYQGFATFLGHVFSWGLKLVMMKVCSQTHLLSYVFILTRVAEEHGGVATAYHYDVKVRKEMATELEREKPNVLRWLLELNDDTARAAKDKAQSGAGRVAKFASAAAAGSSAQSAAGNHGRGSGGKAVGKGGKSGKGDNR
ncbi:unnamed protein product, partial [Prorocentrum cordatum]